MKTLDLSDYISKAERALLGLCYTCASAPSVEVTTLGSLCDFHWTGDHGDDSFQSKHLSTKLRIKPPVLKWHQNSQTRHRSGSKLPIDPKEYFTTIDTSEYCLARWTSWLAKNRSLTLGAGKTLLAKWHLRAGFACRGLAAIDYTTNLQHHSLLSRPLLPGRWLVGLCFGHVLWKWKLVWGVWHIPVDDERFQL